MTGFKPQNKQLHVEFYFCILYLFLEIKQIITINNKYNKNN